MKSRLKPRQLGFALIALGVATAAIAATALSFSTPVNVSSTATPTEKAKAVRLAYQDGTTFKKAWLYTYGDGDVGRENVYAKFSFDEGVTWSAPILLSKDATGYPTGGQYIVTQSGYLTTADNNKPNIFAPPTTSGPKVVVSWTSAYCPQDPTAANTGPYTSSVQGQSDLDGDGIIDHPFYCTWTATTTDPALQTWTTTQLTNGARDAIGDVASGNATGTAFTLAWQEDPAGLQPGEAEGPGDGSSGATVSSGTNIWYTYSPANPVGATFRTNITQVSDNNVTGTPGLPGASRPNLAMSGNTAVLVYEETACTGGSIGKCIVYHSFPYNTPDRNSAGTIVSDVTQNARRVRVVLQGAAAAPSSGLRTFLLWRESAPSAVSGAPADIVIRRGFAGASASGSSGFTAADILVDTPQKMTNIAASGGNANAHRAVMRDGFVALAYDLTPSMTAADPTKTNPPTANYNLYLTRSTDSGATWDTARNISNVTNMAWRVVEPRIVPTPGTIINPITTVADPGDTQNTSTFYIAYATEKNDLSAAAGKVYVSRSTDQGVTLEPFVPVSSAAAGQSESQLRPTPDGSAVGALWMQEQTIGNDLTKDAMFASAVPVTLPPPAATSSSSGCSMAGGSMPFDPTLPALAALGLLGLGLRRARRS